MHFNVFLYSSIRACVVEEKLQWWLLGGTPLGTGMRSTQARPIWHAASLYIQIFHTQARVIVLACGTHSSCIFRLCLHDCLASMQHPMQHFGCICYHALLGGVECWHALVLALGCGVVVLFVQHIHSACVVLGRVGLRGCAWACGSERLCMGVWA